MRCSACFGAGARAAIRAPAVQCPCVRPPTWGSGGILGGLSPVYSRSARWTPLTSPEGFSCDSRCSGSPTRPTRSRPPHHLRALQRSGILRGDEIRRRYRESHATLAGFLDAGDRLGVEVVPLLFAITDPIGTITADAFDRIVGEMLDVLRTTARGTASCSPSTAPRSPRGIPTWTARSRRGCARWSGPACRSAWRSTCTPTCRRGWSTTRPSPSSTAPIPPSIRGRAPRSAPR